MKFRCSRERLLAGLQIVGSVVSSRGMKPVYESVLIHSKDDRLELQGTDLEVAIRLNLEDETLVMEEHGALVVPASRLTAILREVKDEQVEFAWERNVLAVECMKSHFKVMGLPAEEFPEIPDFPEQTAISVPSALFKKMVNRTAFATAREKMRYALNGVLVLLEGGMLRMVGTDGRRLAYTQAEVENPERAELRAIVPTKGMTQIAKVAGDDPEGTVEIAVKENQLAARTQNAVVISRLVEGSYPKFEEVIPVNCERKVLLNREELVAAVRKAALLTNKESRSVRFDFGEGELMLKSRAAEVGEAHVSMPIKLEGEPAEAAFNPDYVLEGVGVMEGEDLTMEFRNPASPAKITDGPDYTYVVMPIDLG